MALGSRDLSQAENKITACKAKQIHKMTTAFIQKDNLEPFWGKILVDIFKIFSALQAVISFSAWDKSRDPRASWPCRPPESPERTFQNNENTKQLMTKAKNLFL